MRILQVIPYFYPAWAYGGPVRVAYELSRGLARRGHEVVVFTTDAMDRRERTESRPGPLELEGMKVYRFRNLSNYLAYNHHLFLSPRFVPAARGGVRSFDVVHLHEYRTLQNAVAYRCARNQHVPYVVHANGSLPRIMTKKGLKRVYDFLFGKDLLKQASRVVSVSSVETEQYKAMGVAGDRIAMVPHGIEPSEYETLPPKGAFRKRHGIGEGDRVILYLGRVHKIKGLDLLARAFGDILRAVPEARLVVAGSDDGYLHAMKKLADDLGIGGRALFVGPIYERSKLEAYVDADVYVLPSTYEIFGVTVLEACACGTPVVLTDRCGVADHIGGRAGIVVPYEATKVAGGVLDVLRSGDRGKRLGQAGRKLVMEEFGWSKAVDKLEALYAGAARERGT